MVARGVRGGGGGERERAFRWAILLCLWMGVGGLGGWVGWVWLFFFGGGGKNKKQKEEGDTSLVEQIDAQIDAQTC